MRKLIYSGADLLFSSFFLFFMLNLVIVFTLDNFSFSRFFPFFVSIGLSGEKMFTYIIYNSVSKKKRKETIICVCSFEHSFLHIDIKTLRNSPFLYGCLLFRRCSLSFRNLLSCHIVSRVCHCQSHLDEQPANIDYEKLETFACSLGNIIKAISYACNKKRHGAIRVDIFLRIGIIHLSIDFI